MDYSNEWKIAKTINLYAAKHSSRVYKWMVKEVENFESQNNTLNLKFIFRVIYIVMALLLMSVAYYISRN